MDETIADSVQEEDITLSQVLDGKPDERGIILYLALIGDNAVSYHNVIHSQDFSAAFGNALSSNDAIYRFWKYSTFTTAWPFGSHELFDKFSENWKVAYMATLQSAAPDLTFHLEDFEISVEAVKDTIMITFTNHGNLNDFTSDPAFEIEFRSRCLDDESLAMAMTYNMRVEFGVDEIAADGVEIFYQFHDSFDGNSHLYVYAQPSSESLPTAEDIMALADQGVAFHTTNSDRGRQFASFSVNISNDPLRLFAFLTTQESDPGLLPDADSSSNSFASKDTSRPGIYSWLTSPLGEIYDVNLGVSNDATPMVRFGRVWYVSADGVSMEYASAAGNGMFDFVFASQNPIVDGNAYLVVSQSDLDEHLQQAVDMSIEDTYAGDNFCAYSLEQMNEFTYHSFADDCSLLQSGLSFVLGFAVETGEGWTFMDRSYTLTWDGPTRFESFAPTSSPSQAPITSEPTASPTTSPSTSQPSVSPTSTPTKAPSFTDPTAAPSISPTYDCATLDESVCRMHGCAWLPEHQQCVAGCVHIPGTALVGASDISVTTTAIECEERCLDERDCIAFSFFLGHCFIFNEYDSIRSEASAISGVCVGTHRPTTEPSRSPVSSIPTTSPSTAPTSHSPTLTPTTSLPSPEPTTACELFDIEEECRATGCAWDRATSQCSSEANILEDMFTISDVSDLLDTIGDISLKQCERACIEHDGCIVFSTYGAMCMLLSGYDDMMVLEGARTGFVIGTDIPTALPTAGPSTIPTSSPSFTAPSSSPSSAPTVSVPTQNPTSTLPSAQPSSAPSVSPSTSPTVLPSGHPSSSPTVMPTASPTASPSMAPTSSNPSMMPSVQPTYCNTSHL